MADRIAILDGEPYAKWIKSSGPAQRLFKAYRSKWPDGTAKCVAIGSDFYVHFQNGEMRHVDSAAEIRRNVEKERQYVTFRTPQSGRIRA